MTMLSGLEEALLKDDKSEALDIINAYYDEIGKDPIISLDHVTSEHATYRLGSRLGFNLGQPNELKQRLIDLEVYSLNLNDYSKQVEEEIAETNIDNFGNNRFTSSYLTKDNPSLEENRKIFAQTEQFEKYLKKEEITSLDHITHEHAASGLGKRLGFDISNPNQLRQRLIELGAFSTDLKQYSKDEIEKIAGINIKNLKNKGRLASSYLTKDNPNLEENRKIFAHTEQFEKYLKKEGIISLDHITSEHATRGLGRRLGFKQGNPNQLKQKLIDFEVYSPNLKDYSKQIVEEIAEINIKNLGNSNFTSLYLTKDNPYLEENRKIFAKTEQFKKYLENEGIISLDHITSKHATRRLGKSLGFKEYNPNQLRQRLIELEVYSPNLKDYSKQEIEEIVKINIENLEKAGHSSYYLTEVNPNREENRKIFAQTEQFKEYLKEKSIISLDHITLEHAPQGLGSKLGFKYGNPNQLRQRLIEMEVFSTDLNDYSKQKVEEITEIIINKLSTRHQSAYFSDYINQKDIEQNKQTILKTQAVQKFFAKEKVDLKDSKTIKSKKAKSFFRKILGINVDENNLESKLKKIFKSSDVSYRRVNTVWDEREEHMLYDISDNYRDEEDLRDELKENKKHYQEQFGRSIFAIITKMERMGILSQQTTFRNGTRIEIDKYPFPKIHKEEFNDYMIEFQNTSYLLDNNLMPNVIPVFGFDSAVHEQFTHATLPIKYKGVDLVNYTLAEQELIAYTMSYISDNEQFETKDNGDLDATKIFPHSEPRILCLQDEDQQYIQLLFRNSDNPNNQTDTEAIETDSTEVWHLKHEKALTYEETRV